MKALDLNKVEILIGDTVNVPKVIGFVNNEFTGTVKAFNSSDDKVIDYVIVEDQNGDCFSVEPELLEVEIEEEYNHFVDIPRSDINDKEWINVESFKSKEDAIKFAQEHFGADENGMICIISSC